MLLHALVILLVASDLGFCLDEVLLDIQWEQWKIRHGKVYNNEEIRPWTTMTMTNSISQNQNEEHRKDIWKKNMHLIEVHNQEAEQGTHSYRLGMNHLGDMTSKEMNEKMMRFRVPPSQEEFSYCKSGTSESCKTEAYRQEATQDCPKQSMMDYIHMVYNTNCLLEDLPESIDYREKGMVTSVKDQGSCGSCWAFSAVGALEGQLARTTGQLLDLSPQNLVDCDQESKGCGGGYMTSAFKYVQENGGINSEKDYPYVGKDQACKYNSSAVAAQCKGFKKIRRGDEYALAKALYHVGPLSVSIDASRIMLYSSGVYYNPQCDKNNLDHAMLLVGYGETAEGEKYWIVKNSFGANWGDNGYIRIARDRDNHCGIASDARYPIM
ncbi:cathepsin K-like [Trachinotus anak]|uniref:cathepsin K-like n=1 Tax=Trachinotus anak TaxID=443729 RepID=UPI0039F1F3DF